jgi:predicted nucleic acid-binding Zn ribbon protein
MCPDPPERPGPPTDGDHVDPPTDGDHVDPPTDRDRSGAATPTPAHDDTGLDLARTLTRSLRSASRGRRASVRSARREDTELSGAHPDGRDPALLGDAVEKLVNQSGWSRELAVHGVFARWPEIVGTEVASHSQPESFTEGRLVVRADSTAWATELRLQAGMVLKRVNEELGHDTVTIIDFAGPDAPSWIKGRRTTRGGRGPRDTYG